MNMQRRVPGRRAQSELVLSPSARQAQDEEKFQPDEQDSHNTIHIDEIKWGSRLGEGAFGEVFRGEVAGCNVAIKVIKGARKGDVKIFSAFKKEIDPMRALRLDILSSFLRVFQFLEHMSTLLALLFLHSLSTLEWVQSDLILFPTSKPRLLFTAQVPRLDIPAARRSHGRGSK